MDFFVGACMGEGVDVERLGGEWDVVHDVRLPYNQ